MKKKITSPHHAIVANLLGEDRARRMRDSDSQKLVNAVTLKKGTFRVSR